MKDMVQTAPARLGDKRQPDRISPIVELGRQGLSASEIAQNLGITRNTVLGICFRAGVKLGDLNGWADRLPKPRREIATPKIRRERIKHAGKSEGARRTAETLASLGIKRGWQTCYPEDFKITAVAAYLCGKSGYDVARAMGCSPVTIYKCWSQDEALVAKAEPIARAVMNQVARRQAERQAAADLERMRQHARVAEHNAPILAVLNNRQRLICERYLGGQTLQEIGDALGVTRERIRQLMAPALRLGLDTSAVGRTNPVRRAANYPVPTVKVTKEKVPKAKRKTFTITEEERERRRQHGRWLGSLRRGVAQ